jgi:uncharacterized protein YcsI (UPF0317 family)
MAQLPRFDDPLTVRLACREERLDVFPSRTINGFLCVNVVMLERAYAGDFERFCRANPASCPLLAVVPAGQWRCPERWARDCDLRTDLRSYDVIENGLVTRSVPRVDDLFHDGLVTFLIGSSVSFDGELEERGWKPGWGPCIYETAVACAPVGVFRGPMAVTMRTFPATLADRVAEFTSHFPDCHGGPIGRNDPAALGIADEDDYLLPPPEPGPIPSDQDRLYWGCGITPSRVAQQTRLALMIVHTPGNALVTDVRTMEMWRD